MYDRKDIVHLDIHTRKWELSKDTSIVTAGSCFAQHIGRRLRNSGFNLLDKEPPPPQLPVNLQPSYGYGLYSARFGNIYTIRQLLRLLQECLGVATPSDYIWVDSSGLYRDALRPNIEPNGYFSADQVVQARAYHLQRVRAAFQEFDLFIFTLGLTETWECKADGFVYPTAPGVVCGRFNGMRYSFLNLSFMEMLSDFNEIKRLLHLLNPKPFKILLTVSPVPLTATATEKHVLVATIASKSTLRALTNELADNNQDVDYFPSYEIITNPWAKSRYYADNLRSVTEEGVEAVMTAFEHSFSLQGCQQQVVRDIAWTKTNKAADPVCEDVLLSAFSPKQDAI